MTPTPDPAEALARAIRQSNSASPTAPTANERTLARAYLTQSERLRAAEGLLREVEWSGWVMFDYDNRAWSCPCCNGICPGHLCAGDAAAAGKVIGHKSDCALAAFLACQPAREAT